MTRFNLQVLTDYVRELAEKQREAGGDIAIAANSVGNITSDMWKTHGVVCAATNLAMGTAEAQRTAAGEKLGKVSTELAQSLDSAADIYEHWDDALAKRM